MSNISVLDVSEAVCYDLRSGVDSLYNLYEQFFVFAKKPESFKDGYDEIGTRLRSIWLLLDYALRDLEGAHGQLEDRRLQYLHTVLFGESDNDTPPI